MVPEVCGNGERIWGRDPGRWGLAARRGWMEEEGDPTAGGLAGGGSEAGTGGKGKGEAAGE